MEFDAVVHLKKIEIINLVLRFVIMQGYFNLSYEDRRELLILLAKEYDLNRTQVRELIKQYLGLELPGSEFTISY